MFPYNQLRLAAALNHARNSPTGGPTSSSGPEAPPQTNSTSSPGSSGGPPGTGTPQTTGNPFASMPSPYGPLDPLIAFRSAGGCGFPPGAAPPGSRFMHEEPKPQQSYIGLIAMAILSTPDKKMVLSDIYQWILDNYNYFRTRGPGWRNSIRHNLSLNDCFVKAGRSANGKGHYWAIHPANMEDFLRGDFRRRRAQRKVRRHMGLSVGDDEDDSDDSPCGSPLAASLPFFAPGGKPPFGFPLGPFGPIGGGPLPFPLLQNPVAFASALGIPPMPPASCPPLPGNLANLSALLAEQQHLMQSRNPPSNPNNPSSDTSALHDNTKATSSTSGGAPSQISPTDSSGSSESPTTSHSTSDGPQNLVMTPPQSEGGEHHRGAQKRARPCSSTGTFDVLSLLSAKRAKAADSETSTSDNETTTTTRNKLSLPGKIPGLVPVTSQQQAPGIGLWNPAAMALAGNPWSALLAATYANSFPLPAPVSGNSIVPSMNACTNNNTNTATRPTTANARTTSVLVAPTTTTAAATPVNANQSSPEPARQANNNSPNTALQWQETFAKIMARSYQGRQQAAEEKLKQQQQQAVALQASAHDK